jgi:hypothetical protein
LKIEKQLLIMNDQLLKGFLKIQSHYDHHSVLSFSLCLFNREDTMTQRIQRKILNLYIPHSVHSFSLYYLREVIF